jgi:SAM-dependent methyltransferase
MGATEDSNHVSRGSDPTQFSAVDDTADPNVYVKFMEEGHRLADIVAVCAIATDLLQLRTGNRVLDVGCGPALDAADLAARIGPAGELVGVDLSQTMITAARQRALALATPTRFEVGSAYELPFEEASFDACRAERLFMHLDDAARALREMCRVTRPGGRVCVVDFDWHTMLIDHPDEPTTELILHSFAADMADGRIGRKLRRMFVHAGLSQPEISMHPVRITPAFCELLLRGYLARASANGRLRPEQADRWWDQLAATVDDQTYFVVTTSFIAAADKPPPR